MIGPSRCRGRYARKIRGPVRFFLSLPQQIEAERSVSIHSMRSQGSKLEKPC
jgi:hypothetical protein